MPRRLATVDTDDGVLRPAFKVPEASLPFSDQSMTYNPDGTVATVTKGGVTTTYTYNGDGTVATDTRLGVTRAYTYTDGNLTEIEAV